MASSSNKGKGKAPEAQPSRTMLSSGQLFQYDRFEPPGVSYKAKLIGVEAVKEARGDQMCQDAMGKLKAMVKVSGEHKQRVIINISTAGVRILDEKTMNEEYLFEVQRVSFVSRDPTDTRAFGLVAGEEGSHKFLGIKTEKQAYNVVMALKELFETVLKNKQAQMEAYNGGRDATDNEVTENPYTEVPSRPRQEAGNTQPQTRQEDPPEDPSSLYAVVNKKPKEPKESLADLARQVEHMQEGLTNMEQIGDFSFPPPPTLSTAPRRTSSSTPAAPLSPTPEVNLAEAQAAASSSQSPDAFGSSLFDAQPPAPAASAKGSASDDLFREFGDTFNAPPPPQPQPQPQISNPFGATPSVPPRNYQQPYAAPFQPQPFQPMFQQRSFGAPPPAANPFGSPPPPTNGDMFGGPLMQPKNVAPSLTKEEPKQPDPFADLSLLGEKPAKSGRDQFSGFQMAKPGEVGLPTLTLTGSLQTSGENAILPSSTCISESPNDKCHDKTDTHSLDSYDIDSGDSPSSTKMKQGVEKDLNKFEDLDLQVRPGSESGFEESLTITSQSSEGDLANDQKLIQMSFDSDTCEKFLPHSQTVSESDGSGYDMAKNNCDNSIDSETECRKKSKLENPEFSEQCKEVLQNLNYKKQLKSHNDPDDRVKSSDVEIISALPPSSSTLSISSIPSQDSKDKVHLIIEKSQLVQSTSSSIQKVTMETENSYNQQANNSFRLITDLSIHSPAGSPSRFLDEIGDIPSPEFSPPPLPKGFAFPPVVSAPVVLTLDEPPPLPKRVPQVEVDRGGIDMPPPLPHRSKSKSECSTDSSLTDRGKKQISSSLVTNQSNWAKFDEDTSWGSYPKAKTISVGSLDSAWIKSDNANNNDPFIVHASSNSTSNLTASKSSGFLSDFNQETFSTAFDSQLPSQMPCINSSDPFAAQPDPFAIREDPFAIKTDPFALKMDPFSSDPFTSDPFTNNRSEQNNQSVSLSSTSSSRSSFPTQLSSPMLPVHNDPFADDPFSTTCSITMATSPSTSSTQSIHTNSLSSSNTFNVFPSTDTAGGGMQVSGVQVNNGQRKQLTTSTGIPLLSDDPFGLQSMKSDEYLVQM